METTHSLWSPHDILTTKLRIPASAGSIVERPRLYALLDQALCRPVTMLSAPPGFGKTTLVADWLRRTQAELACAWVSLTEHDNQLGAFWSYVFAATGDAVLNNTNQFALLNTLRRNGLEAALIQWLNSLDERAEPLVIVIDNYQYIRSAALNDSLAFVIEHLPRHVHVILLANHDPLLPLPRWRVRGTMAEIRADELSCTVAEATAFLSSNELQHSANEIDTVVKHAEGWFAGLRLISMALQQAQDTSSLLEDTSGAYVYEYVRNEILADQEAEIHAFLLHTCVLDAMCPELCDAVLATNESTPTPSYHMLRKLERQSLFVVPLDGQRNWYRYHRLFREALRHLLLLEQPELLDTLLQRASAWYRSRNQPNDFAQNQQLTLGLQIPKRPDVRTKPGETVREREVGAATPVNYLPVVVSSQPVWSAMPAHELSPREHEVLMLIAEGASNYEIADKLVLSLHTVKRHASNILAKLNAANRTQAVAYARASGFLGAKSWG